MSAEPITVDRHDATVVVTLNRPDRRNAFDAAMMGRLADVWCAIREQREVRCLVITGADPAFCAGADMSLLEHREGGAPTARDELRFLPGEHVDVPVITAVNGVCAGGGLHFVADADIVIASERATFVDPHVSVGQVSALEPLPLMLRARPDAVVRMALLGRHERLGAASAMRVGLVSEVVPHERLLERAHELAGLIAANSPAAVARTRTALRSLERSLLDAPMEYGWNLIREQWENPDADEGPRAFIERRDPRWSPP